MITACSDALPIPCLRCATLVNAPLVTMLVTFAIYFHYIIIWFRQHTNWMDGVFSRLPVPPGVPNAQLGHLHGEL